MIAVASLAIGSAALVAAPATAATSTGITRDMVLTAATALRADSSTVTPEAQAALDALASRSCTAPTIGAAQTFGQAVQTPDGVDGLAVTRVVTSPGGSDPSPSTCSFVALAPIGANTTFTGDALVNTTYIFGTPSSDDPAAGATVYPLSGDVFVSPAFAASVPAIVSVRSTGLLTGPGSKRVLTTTKVADKKSKAVKRYAKKKYVSRLKAAKKAYATALKKAGTNQAKKDQARMAYASRKASVTSLYKYQVANYKLVKIRSSQADARRFSVTASIFGN